MTEVANFWGERGAGCIIRAADTGRMLLGLRSAEVGDPLTWGTWGGEVDPGEAVEDSVVREVFEETGYDGDMSLEKIFTYTHRSGFIYDTFMATIPREFLPSLCWETDEASWFERGRWPDPLHYGMEALIAARPELLVRPKGDVPCGNGRRTKQAWRRLRPMIGQVFCLSGWPVLVRERRKLR